MIEIKESVIERIQQSFEILKENFKQIILPLFLYNLGALMLFVLIGGGVGLFFNANSVNDPALFETFNSQLASIMIGVIILIVMYMILYIPVMLATLYTIKHAIDDKKISLGDSMKFGISRIISSFRTYWHIFAYVALIPALICIVGGLFVIFGLFQEMTILRNIGLFISGGGIVLFIIFSVYRGVKSSLAFSSAIQEDQFTKENFNTSLSVTQNNWWRILGNLLLPAAFMFVVMILLGFFMETANIIFSDTFEIFEGFGLFDLFKVIIYRLLEIGMQVYFFVFI